MIAFGPVPSRRLGRSLGINNIPAKICSYACVYCQIGRTLKMSVERKKFYEPSKIFEEAAKRAVDKIDYITFVPDGEPTLDINIGKEIEMLKKLGRVAVITNSSLIWKEDVREDIKKADLVSLKIDAASEKIWKRVNRPHPSLSIEKIRDGMIRFSEEFDGKLITETMLINGIDYSNELHEIAEMLKEIRPDTIYISIPTRPPAESWITPAGEDVLLKAYNLFSRISKTEYLIGYEGNEFSSTGDVVYDLMSITAVHPMREDAVEKLLKENNASWDVVMQMIKDGRLMEIEYSGKKFYMRKLAR
ncbi:MAG: radical SAM protein [Thermoplasmata archaeon]|nr:radical SAM protein [Thermoplasmata archaeon]